MSEPETKTRAKKKRIITFIYSTGKTDQKIDLVSSEVTESSVSAAWRRVSSAKGITAQSLLGAISGEKTLLEDQLRKPTYAELQQQLALLQQQQEKN